MGGKSDSEKEAEESNNLIKKQIANQKQEEGYKLESLYDETLVGLQSGGGMRMVSDSTPSTPLSPSTPVSPSPAAG